MQTTITVAQRTWTLEPTGLQRVAYALTSGNKRCTGIRDQHKPHIIVVLDRHHDYVGAFDETTQREVTRLR